MKPTTIANLNVEQTADDSTLTATVEIGDSRHEIYYRTPPGPLGEGGNVLLAATLVPAMGVGRPLRIPAPLSEKMLQGMTSIQEVLQCWYAGYESIPIEAESRPDPPDSRPRGVGCFFSAGVDSFYTLLQHQQEIDTLIHIHGFDIRLEDRALREKVTASIRQAARDLGKDLIEVETNLRAFSDRYACWPTHQFGAALASVAHLLAPRLRKVYLPASLSYLELDPCGSHPLLDPHWSSENLEIELDGAEATRLEKVGRIAESETALNWLRVCWQNTDGAYNCGQCEKCLRTMIELELQGALQRCRTFDRLDPRLVARIDVTNKYQKIFVLENLKVAEAQAKNPELIHALRQARDRRYYRGPRRWINLALARIPWLRSLYRALAGKREA